jgi:hypothetical protein
VFTPCRFGRRSLPLSGNVRVGPPAMSFVHFPIFLRRHFCGSINKVTTTTKLGNWGQGPINFAYQKITSGRQRGCFFRAKAQKKSTPDGRPKRDSKMQKSPKNKTPLQRGFEDTRAFKNQAAVNQ